MEDKIIQSASSQVQSLIARNVLISDKFSSQKKVSVEATACPASQPAEEGAWPVSSTQAWPFSTVGALTITAGYNEDI